MVNLNIKFNVVFSIVSHFNGFYLSITMYALGTDIVGVGRGRQLPKKIEEKNSSPNERNI